MEIILTLYIFFITILQELLLSVIVIDNSK